MIGITVGVGTVLAMMAVGAGAQRSIEQQVRAAGLNQITVTAGNWKPKTEDSGAAVAHQGDAGDTLTLPVPELMPQPLPRSRRRRRASPAIPKTTRWRSTTIRWRGSGSATSRRASARRRRCRLLMPRRSASSTACNTSRAACTPTRACSRRDPTKRWFTRMHGTDLQLLDIKRTWTLTGGRFFTEREQENAEQVIVLGQVVAEKLFGAGRRSRGPDGDAVEAAVHASSASSRARAGSCGPRPETTSSMRSTCRTRRPIGCST